MEGKVSASGKFDLPVASQERQMIGEGCWLREADRGNNQLENQG